MFDESEYYSEDSAEEIAEAHFGSGDCYAS
jgi:hypothetical protein